MKAAYRFDASAFKSALTYVLSVGVTLLLFLALGATQRIEIDPPLEEAVIEEFYIPAPPPPKPKPKEEVEIIDERDFSISIDPEPFELSLDYLQVKVGIESKAFTEVTFDLDSLIDEHKTDGLEKLVVFEKADVDEPPVMTRRIMPNIPEGIRSGKIRAVVQYRVTPEGTTENITIFNCNVPELIPAIQKSLEKCRFKPAIKNGEAVNVWVRHAYVVQLGGKSDNPFDR